MTSDRTRHFALVVALATYVVWTAATWYFEGRIETLLRPDATIDRLVYALGVNLLLGIAGSAVLLRWLGRRPGAASPDRAGFGSRRRALVCAVIGLVLGLASYLAQGAPSRNPVVIANAFAQVFVVSVAEVVVCWALVGAAIEAALAPRIGRASTVVAAIVSAALFGVYHFAHSPPFDTWPMVALLSVVGLVTGLFFFLSRDVLGTAVFHNFLGTYGVTQALAASSRLDALAVLQTPLVGTALATSLVLLAGYWWIRRDR